MKKIILIAAAALVSLSASAQKFAHVNFNELVMLMPAADSARAQIAASQQEAQDTYKSMTDEFQVKYQQYQQKSSTWTPAIRESKEKLMAPIQQRAVAAVEKLAKEGGYIYVFEKASMLYVDETQSVDLTPAARKALNIPDGRTLETLQQELQAQSQKQ